MTERTVNLTKVIDDRPVTAFQWRVYLICFLIVLIDGFDTQIIGFSAKAISETRHIPLQSFGGIFSIGLLGAMIGAFALGPLADVYGRRTTLVFAIIIFSVATILLPLASSFGEFAASRFVAGLGLGGAIPNLIALSSEYTPARHRGTMSGLLYSAYPLGGVVGAVASSFMLPAFGWELLFYLGGAFPLLLGLLVLAAMPESPQFLARRRDAVALGRIAVQLGVMEPGRPVIANDNHERLAGVPIRHLFDGKRASATALLWLAFFTCYGVIIILVLWTPALLSDSGATASAAATVSGMVSAGGVVGTTIGGRILDRYGAYPALPILFFLGALCVAPIGYMAATLPVVATLAALSGLLLGSVSTALLALAVAIYPVEIRATGLGWGIGMARMGQVAAPLAVGGLMGLGQDIASIFLWAALPAACGAAALAWRRPQIGAA